MAWSVYVAIEPHVRRLWPRALVSWTRLVSGRLRDPMVGRDVLVGVFLALAGNLARVLLLGPIPSQGVEVLGSFRRVLAVSLPLVYAAAAQALILLLLTVVLRRVLRSQRGALVVVALLVTVPNLAGHVAAGGPLAVFSLSGLYGLTLGILIATALVRFGLLTTATVLYVFLLVDHLPLALDLSVWYGAQASFVVLLVAALAVAGFLTSLGVRPLLGHSLLHD